jgi:hypothetical protein
LAVQPHAVSAQDWSTAHVDPAGAGLLVMATFMVLLEDVMVGFVVAGFGGFIGGGRS